jgi:periplasmic nitrate reductase NapD
MTAESVHISSAVVRTRPEDAVDVVAQIDAFPDCEVYHQEDGKIVVVLEGPSSDPVGSRLSEISLLDGVLSASLVYEQIETAESLLDSHPESSGERP